MLNAQFLSPSSQEAPKARSLLKRSDLKRDVHGINFSEVVGAGFPSPWSQRAGRAQEVPSAEAVGGHGKDAGVSPSWAQQWLKQSASRMQGISAGVRCRRQVPVQQGLSQTTLFKR